MKNWKKAITAAIIGMTVMGMIAGCGGEKSSGNGTADAKNTAKFGFVTAYTGPGAAYGQSQKEGGELAIEEINKDPNTKIKIDLITYDSKLNKSEAINAFNRLINQDKVLAIQGTMTSGEMFAAGPLAQKAGVAVMGSSTTAPKITEIGDCSFRNAVPGKIAIPITLKKAHEKIGFKTAAVMYSHNNDQLVGENETYQKTFQEMGIPVVATETFADKDTDFSAQLTKIQAASPDIICIAGLYTEGALIVKKAREMGMTQPIIGNNGFNGPTYIKLAGEAAEGTLVSTPWNPNRDSEKAKHFVKAYTEKYGHEPDQFAAQAYDAFYIMHQALENSGTTTDRKKYRDALAQIRDFEGATGKFSFNEDRDPVMDMDVLIVKDGKWVPYI